MLRRRDFLAAALAAPLVARRASAAPRPRAVARVVDGEARVDGAGVHLNRALGGGRLPQLDPFLLLDEIHSDRPEDYAPGFPTHPHRGFETVTYVLDGAFEHRDSLGHHGRLERGSAQWMTAGHGIVHSEMPGQREGGMWVFQLWSNLPASAKMMRPRYQDVAPSRITPFAHEDAEVRLVAGALGGRVGPVDGIVTAPLLADVKLGARGRASFPIADGHAAFAYVVDGRVRLGDGGPNVLAGQLAVLGPGDRLAARADEGARFLLFAGRPIGEPIARSGPFVMNSDAECAQAWADYRAGRLVDPSL